jgi:hypothetical protein
MDAPQLVMLPKILDERGNLSFIEGEKHIPFKVKRTYWIYDVPGGDVRGGHAYKSLQEFVVALSGSFDLLIDDGSRHYKFSLNRSYVGVYVPAGYWRSLENFSTNSLALILASQPYNEDDYIRKYDDFLAFRK